MIRWVPPRRLNEIPCSLKWCTLSAELQFFIIFFILPCGMKTSHPKNCQSSSRITWQLKSFDIHAFCRFLFFASIIFIFTHARILSVSQQPISGRAGLLITQALSCRCSFFFFLIEEISEQVIWRHLLSRCYWFYTQHHLLSPAESLGVKLIDCFIFFSLPSPPL